MHCTCGGTVSEPFSGGLGRGLSLKGVKRKKLLGPRKHLVKKWRKNNPIVTENMCLPFYLLFTLCFSRSAKRNRSYAIPRQLQIRGRIHAGKKEEENNGYVVINHMFTNRWDIGWWWWGEGEAQSSQSAKPFLQSSELGLLHATHPQEIFLDCDILLWCLDI